MTQKKKRKQRKFYGLMGSHIVWTQVPRKGRGVFATRKIKKGEIVEVAPVVPVSKKNVPDDEAPDGWVLDWDEDKPGKEYAMAMGYIMLYNHSEDPNIELESDLAENTVTVVAIRDIRAGEELAWDYGCEIWFKKH
ncbi:MAG: SET domain-containing protein-lysine N-methyltransferase [Alphaproteobacteria bacterium]|nr:SET domain-containing protein-lysine N-methyltransferase [Alphaproteobacteria bacterium]